MPPLPIVFTLLFFLRAPASSAATDTILAGQGLAVNNKLVSNNGRYALGFFNTSSSKPSQDTTNWYLGIWFNTVPKFTSAWVANRDKPITNTTSVELTVSQDGNLVILNRSTKSIIWSTQANITRNSTTAMLLSSGNLVLTDFSNSSEVLWQSFDHPTDTLFSGAKLGRNKATDLDRRIVSSKNLIDPASGVYCYELDPSGINQFFLTPLNSSTPYWSGGVWGGTYYVSIPWMSNGSPTDTLFTLTFIDNDQETYMTHNILRESIISHYVIDVSGQLGMRFWDESSQDWLVMYTQPKVADFGMAKLFRRDYSRVLTTVRGTAGYLAPEWITGVAITPKVDVYSYGMVLLEIISGKRNSCAPCTTGGNLDIFFPVYAAHKLAEGEVGSLVDEMLHGDVNLDEAELACKVACLVYPR